MMNERLTSTFSLPAWEFEVVTLVTFYFCVSTWAEPKILCSVSNPQMKERMWGESKTKRDSDLL